MSKTDVGVLVGAIVAILIALGAFNSPDIVPFRQSKDPDSICSRLFGDTLSVFFTNLGNKPGILCVNVSSIDIAFRKTQDCITIPNINTQTTEFSFPISSRQNVLYSKETYVIINWEYSKLLGQIQGSVTCIYNRTQSDSIVLVK